MLNSTALRTRLIAPLIAFFFLFNGVVPRALLAEADLTVVRAALQSQSAVFHFFAFSMFPVKIVNDLFSSRGAAAPLPGKKKHTNTSSDFSLVGSERPSVKRLSDASRPIAFAAMGNTAGSMFSPVKAVAGAPPWGSGAVFLVLVLFFLRPRSSLPEGSVMALCLEYVYARR